MAKPKTPSNVKFIEDELAFSVLFDPDVRFYGVTVDDTISKNQVWLAEKVSPENHNGHSLIRLKSLTPHRTNPILAGKSFKAAIWSIDANGNKSDPTFVEFGLTREQIDRISMDRLIAKVTIFIEKVVDLEKTTAKEEARKKLEEQVLELKKLVEAGPKGSDLETIKAELRKLATSVGGVDDKIKNAIEGLNKDITGKIANLLNKQEFDQFVNGMKLSNQVLQESIDKIAAANTNKTSDTTDKKSRKTSAREPSVSAWSRFWSSFFGKAMTVALVILLLLAALAIGSHNHWLPSFAAASSVEDGHLTRYTDSIDRANAATTEAIEAHKHETEMFYALKYEETNRPPTITVGPGFTGAANFIIGSSNVSNVNSSVNSLTNNTTNVYIQLPPLPRPEPRHYERNRVEPPKPAPAPQPQSSICIPAPAYVQVPGIVGPFVGPPLMDPQGQYYGPVPGNRPVSIREMFPGYSGMAPRPCYRRY